MEILYTPKTISYKPASFQEAAQDMEMMEIFQEMVMNSKELAMTLQNIDLGDLGAFLMNTLEHYLKLFSVHLDDPVQMIQLIR